MFAVDSERQVTDTTTLALRIKRRFEQQAVSDFPTDDIGKLTRDYPKERSRFHGIIDLYLSGVAGYACGADRLNCRSVGELRAANQFLSKSFFEKYAEFAHYQSKITPDEMPDLFGEMETAELNRRDLLQEVKRLLPPG